MSQSVERWRSRAIWVVSRADIAYPRRLKKNLRENAPPILYGCGDAALLDNGGLAVVGSRNVDDELVKYTERIGQLAAKVAKTIISGGARGIDQAAMRGALDNGGRVIGVMADKLEQATMNRENRDLIMNGKLVLISPYDPAAGFNVGNAMQRNKLIYALADVALVVSSDLNKGGTWSGAVEQLEKLKLVPVYVRPSGGRGSGLEALQKKGALPWPDPQNSYDLAKVLAKPFIVNIQTQEDFSFAVQENADREYTASAKGVLNQSGERSLGAEINPAEELFVKFRELLREMPDPKTEGEVSAAMGIPKGLAKQWLQRLVKESVLIKLAKPVRYRSVHSDLPSLFEKREPH